MSDHAPPLFARLIVHYPNLGGNDDFARIRAEDWCAVIARARPETAAAAVEELVAGWTDRRHPRIADFQEACRRIATQRAIETPETPALDAPAPDPERLARVLAEARASITDAKGRKDLKRQDPIVRPTARGDATEHMLTYDELYDENGVQRDLS